MLKNVKLSTKITAGFAIITLFLVVVGITGYASLSNVIGQMDAIQLQMEIAKKANTILTDGQDAQTASLNYLAYQDEKYNADAQKECDTVVEVAEAAKALMQSAENRQTVDRVVANIKQYRATCDTQKELYGQRETVGKIRTESSANVRQSLQDLADLLATEIKETTRDVEGQKLTNEQAVKQAFDVQETLNTFQETRILAQRYLVAVNPDEQDEIAKMWVSEITKTGKMLEALRQGIKDQQQLEKIAASQQALSVYLEQVDAFRQVNRNVRDLLANKQQPAAEVVMAESRSVRDGVYEFIDEVETEAQSTVLWANRLILGVGIGSLVMSFIIAFFLIRSITKPIIRVADMLTAGAQQTNSAAGQVSSSSQSLAQGASEQAASLEETTASMEEMSSMTGQNADNATEAKRLAESAWRSAEKGTEAMERMSLAINDIKKSSDETSKIIKTIDEIAFQTNLLALNAAVEAARAGEAGKGFAVVAEEVRNLAQRSAEAARTTSDMIAESVKNSDNGVMISKEVAETLNEIADGNRKVNDLVGEIAAASQEQSQGIAQINTAVNQMDQVTQSNAANAEESASAAEELSAQAEELSSIVQELQAIVGCSNSFTQSHSTKTLKKSNRFEKRQRSAKSTSSSYGKVDPEKVIPMETDDLELSHF